MTEVGAVLAGKYRVLAKLGEGGMGSVFRAENQLTGKQVALKCLHAHAAGNADASERLLREARAASSLSHPNVVDVYDVVRDGETVFLVMELLQGETLRQYLVDHPQPKLSEFIALILPALAGVAAAHERGVIHRDLKPDNIMLAKVPGVPGRVIKVLDFGIAKLAVARGPTLTQTGVALGTPLYMSLEQLRGDKDIDQRADVYAFGVMLYEAVTGQLPYDADTLPELAIKVATTDPLPVKSLRPDVPTPLARIIDWAVARDRRQRLPDLQTLQQELDVFARDHSFRDQMTQREAPLPLVAADPAQVLAAQPTAVRPPPRAAGAGKPAGASARPEPDTLRARELLSVTHPRGNRLGRGALISALALGLGFGAWLMLRPDVPAAAEVAVEPAQPSAAAPSAATASPTVATEPVREGPSPLRAPGVAADLVPEQVSPTGSPDKAEELDARNVSPTPPPAKRDEPMGASGPSGSATKARAPSARATSPGSAPGTRPSLAAPLAPAPAARVGAAASPPSAPAKKSSAELVGF